MENIIKDVWLESFLNKKCWIIEDSFNFKQVFKLKNLSKNGFASYKQEINKKIDLTTMISSKFNLVEINTQLQLLRKNFKIQPYNLEINLNYCSKNIKEKEIIDQICKIAEESFTNSRFYQDKFIPNEVASKIKKSWINNYFLGTRGDDLIIATNRSNKVIGFMSLLKGNSNSIIIDLIAVSKNERGKGIGKEMLNFLVISKKYKYIDFILVGTQLKNIQSINFYERSNFLIHKCNYVFHLHW